MYEIKERKYIAPDGYLYHKDGRYVDVVYPTPRQSINEYELIPIAEYEARMNAEESEQATEQDYIEALQDMGVKV